MVRQAAHSRFYRKSGKIARVNPDVIKIRKKRVWRWRFGSPYERGGKFEDKWGNIHERPKDYISYLTRKVGSEPKDVLTKGKSQTFEYPQRHFYGKDRTSLKKPLFPKGIPKSKVKPIIYERIK